MESCALSSRTNTVFAHESLNFHPQCGSSCPSGSPTACTNQKVQWSIEKELCNSTTGAHIDGLINTSIYKLIGSGKIPVIRTLGSLYPSQVWIVVMVIGKWRNAKSCVCPIPITWLAYYRVHSALFLVLLYPHTYFCFSIPISVDVKFLYFDSPHKLPQNLSISTPFPLKREYHTKRSLWEEGGFSNHVHKQLLHNFSS